MSIIKRLTTTLHASVDRTVASLENHEAIIQATLTESRRAVATTKVRLARVEADGKRQEEHVEVLKHRIDTWTQRAKEVGEEDRNKALECLQQRRNDQAQLEQATKILVRHSEMKQRMRDKVISLNERVAELQRQYSELQSRDSVSRATTSLDAIQQTPGSNIEDTFDRWEVSIRERELQNEYMQDAIHSPTTLDEEFRVTENRVALNSELDTLLNNKE